MLEPDDNVLSQSFASWQHFKVHGLKKGIGGIVAFLFPSKKIRFGATSFREHAQHR
jgi:hypothetical protein